MTRTAIWWVRRDLRLEHNPALQAALHGHDSLIPVFILDPHLLAQPAPNRQGFLFAGLRALDASLRARGSRLVIRAGNPVDELARLVAESGAGGVFAAEDYSPYARRRDAAAARAFNLHLSAGITVHPPDAVRKADGSLYTIFTPYSKVWKSLPLAFESSHASAQILPPVPEVGSLGMPSGEAPSGFPAGEEEAQRRLRAFLDGPIETYHDDRNRLDLDGTSVLSPYLRFGMLAPRQAAQAALRAAQNVQPGKNAQGAESWLNELIWREFYTTILFHFPHVLQTAFNPTLRNIPWRESPADLAAWQQGRTGYPLVDAAMRQLLTSGWMHNRGRMLCASFLVKNLLINWQSGERWFMQHLVDGDPAANNGGWQWSAGTGTDAAPYFRIFNPVLQSHKFDPKGDYIRRWLPELARVPQAYIHSPWQMPQDAQSACACRIGRDYPAPIVDLSQTKDRTLAAYRYSKETKNGSAHPQGLFLDRGLRPPEE